MASLAPPPLDSAADFARCLADARAGSQDALGRLLEDCRSYLLFVARAHLEARRGVAVVAADPVQETLLAAVGGFAEFRGSDEVQWLAWLRRILVNHLTNLTLKPAHRTVSLQPQQEPTDSETPSWRVMLEERADAMRRAIQLLAPDYRQVLTFRYFDRMKWEEIGARLHRSPDAARMIHCRALRELGHLLKEPAEAERL